MAKNKVNERCQKSEYAKFYYGADKMFFETKIIKVGLYVLAIIPVVLALIPSLGPEYAFICSIISFALSLINEATSSFMNEHKDKAVLEYQYYETSITGSEFSKVEYDRETTNELNELAIRKGLPRMEGLETFYETEVPEDITDDYSYIYLCRRSAATNRYLLSRIFYIYFFILMGIVALFVGLIFLKTSTIEYLTLIICFYPLVSPFIKDCGKCKECMRDCTKMCADIDNFFADGDASLERLARMYYYVQTLEYEMMMSRPAIFNFFNVLFSRRIKVLQDGVTTRFKAAIVELKAKSLIYSGAISQPKGKGLITKVDYDLEKLKKIEKSKKSKSQTKSTSNQDTSLKNTASKEKTLKKTTVSKPTPKTSAKKTTPKTNETKVVSKASNTSSKKTTSSSTKPSKKTNK